MTILIAHCEASVRQSVQVEPKTGFRVNVCWGPKASNQLEDSRTPDFQYWEMKRTHETTIHGSVFAPELAAPPHSPGATAFTLSVDGVSLPGLFRLRPTCGTPPLKHQQSRVSCCEDLWYGPMAGMVLWYLPRMVQRCSFVIDAYKSDFSPDQKQEVWGRLLKQPFERPRLRYRQGGERPFLLHSGLALQQVYRDSFVAQKPDCSG